MFYLLDTPVRHVAFEVFLSYHLAALVCRNSKQTFISKNLLPKILFESNHMTEISRLRILTLVKLVNRESLVKFI